MRKREKGKEKRGNFIQSVIKNKKIVLITLVLMLIVIAIFIASNQELRNNIVQVFNGKIQDIEENKISKTDMDASIIGEKGKITSAQIIQTKTGTGPWDTNDDPGNDSSEDNKIVRSFDQVTWTVDVTMALKEVTETGLMGGIINVNVTLPSVCANVMAWDLENMSWLENGKVSDDGITLTGQYSMSEEEQTIPGKQTLVFVLQVKGAGNGSEIVPTFTFNLEGNEENEQITITGETIIVSAKGKYNIQLVRNASLAFKTTVDYGEGNTEGRMYGYNFVIQLYNETESKGLKGVEYPKGEITFDINLQLQRSKFETTELEDITDECTPVLWNYRLNDWSSDLTGNIEGREMFMKSSYHRYNPYLPLGVYVNDRYSTYDSGDISIVQEKSTLHITVSDYALNGIFPYYEANFLTSPDSGRDKVYTDNIGTFSIGYMQIFVPNNEASTIEDRNYYLTVSDSSLNMTSITSEKITEQMENSDDSLRVEHVLYRKDTYAHQIILEDANGKIITSDYDTGDGKANIGQAIQVATKIITNANNDNDIFTLNRFFKFDGEGFEPIYYSNGDKYKWNSGTEGNPKFRIWYVTKKDGSNWISQTEMNNADIEDMDIYDEIEDIPESKICVGIYAELIDGYIYRGIASSGNHLVLPLKIRNTATIGETYGMTQRTQVWSKKLDRSIYTVTNPNVEWPEADWDTQHRQYIKTEYDENGEIISGTHSGAFQWGNTVLVIGANLHGSIQAIDESNVEKVNYDLGKNENMATFKIVPQIDSNSNLTQQISGINLKAKVTLSEGMKYKLGSCEYAEPEIINNSNGTQDLVWYIYGCTSGTAIEPITFEANIDNESENGTQYTTQFVISEVTGPDGISKIGNSEITYRTSTETINIINLASHRLYKEVETPVIEKNGQITYTVVYENKTEETVPDFQLLDILPYNGDSRGTVYNGTYTLNSVKVNQTISGTTQSNTNLKLYTTNSDNVKNMTAKDEGIGTDSIWSSKTIGNTLNENIKGIAITGELQGRAKLEIEITLNTTGNKAKDVYGNNAMAQVYADSEQMQTGIVQAQVVNRKIEGKVWEDGNENGIIDNNESGMQGITVKLINTETNQEVKTTTTNAQGEYSFTDLDKAIYKVKIEYEDIYYLTEKNVGDNIEINSKFNTSTNETDEIQTLNSDAESPEMVERNVNAGLIKVKYNINTKVEGEGGKITGQGEDIYETVNKGEDSKKDIVITPDYGYQVSKITVNGEEIEFTEEENHIVTLNKFINMQENKTVVVSFDRIEGEVITHHYIEGTEEKVPALEGGVIEAVRQTGYVGDGYTTKKAENIANNYEYVSNTENASGEIIEGTTEVIYYYKLKTPEITNSEIRKESDTEKVTDVNQAIDYTVNYKTTINTYIGKATVTIVDTLPYEIDEGKSNIAEGTYNKENKTITWTEEVGDINTFINGAKEIEITKEISLVYKDIDVTQSNVTNRVTGTIKLETPEKEETVENTKEIPTEYLVNILVNKIWKDNEIQSNRRPESIILVVKNGDQEITTKEITKEKMVEGTTNQWSTTIEGLQRYDDNGNEIQYTVEEREKYTGDLKFYEAEEAVVKVEDNQATIRNSFKTPNDTTNVTVTKIWNDSSDVNGKRPESVKLQVKNGDSVVKEQIVNVDNVINGDTNSWQYTFTDLAKYDENGQEIVYTVEEQEVNTNDLKFYINDGITGDMTNGYTITNTFTVPDERIDLTVNKVWVDNTTQAQRRPESIIINVKGEDGSVVGTYELNIETETSHTFTNLPKYNNEGNEIQYIVEEQEKNVGDLKFYTTTVGKVTNVANEENQKQVTITNTFEKPNETTEVTVTKVWNDNGNEAQKRPESIKLQLKNGNNVVKEQEVNETNAVSGNTNTWQYTFTGIEKYNNNGEEIVYTVDEAETNSGDLQFYNKNISGLTVTNTFTQDTTTVEVPVTKIWVDNEVQEQRRPSSVIIVLRANGTEIQRYELSEESAETADEDIWRYTFRDLPKYDSYNNIINYTVEEQEKNVGDLKFYTKSIKGTTITNTFTKPTDTISIEVNKEWVDQENIYEKRPVSIRVEVKIGETTVNSAVVTKDNGWTTTFTNLLKYDENGQEINYTVDEEVVLTNDLFYYEKTIGEVSNKEGTSDEKEATITNTMTKIPSTVVVKYVDKNTGEEISEEKIKEGIIGDTFDVTEDKKEIEGYTLVEEPAEKTGVYTSEIQEKIYYYAKNTKVIVKYLEKDDTPEDIADNKVLSKEKTMLGYEGERYSTVKEEIAGYTFVESTDNTKGTMQRDEIVVVYYYAPNTNVIVKYLEQDDTPNDNSDNTVLIPERTIEGYVGKEYITVEEEIAGYTFVESTDNTEGTMAKDPIEIIYYYAQNTKVIVKYLEKDTNIVLAEEENIKGYAGKEYEAKQKTVPNYTFVESTDNTKGTMTKEPIEVIYYYAQNTKATVQYIDRETGEILKQETENGKVGDLFETHPEDFEGYVLVESPEEPNIIMDKTGNQIVKYYYAHVSAGVIEKHIDDITGELLYSAEHEGNEGDYYNIPSKTFEGYDLMTEDKEGNSKLPINAEGEMKREEVIEVKYYYIKKATVVVKYIDENTGEEIVEEERIEGHENDSYETEAKDIKDYNLTKTPDNASGTITITKNPDGSYDTEIEVIYYYKKIAGGVIENHIDITTNKKLATEEHQGNVGDAYDILSREFEGYDLVTDMLPTNSKGIMTEREIEVNYYYIKQAKVKVEYIDKLTGEKLDEEEIQAHVGDNYETEEKEFDGYDLVEKPSNSTGEMKEEEIVVKYYYARKAEVEVKYLERGTEYEIAKSEIIGGYVGDKYETEQKEIPYYNFVEKTDNDKGTMQKDKIIVIYYYEKQVFNLSIDKWVSSVNVDGISQGARNINNKDEIYVVDIHRSKTDTANIKITYKIRVTNKGEIEGTAGEIVEVIPAGYSYYQEDNNIHWEERKGTLVTDVLKDETIEQGEYKEIEIVLRWNTGEDNFGEKENLVILSGEENPAGYEDVNKEDNHSSSGMIITVATGLDRNDRIILIAGVQILILVAIGLTFGRKTKHKGE